MGEMKISLVIPAFNEEKYIGKCLDNAIENSDGKFYEIIVVDNASTDDTEMVAKMRPGTRVVREEQKGLTRARQRGFLEAGGDIIAWCDADTLIPVGWLEMIHKEFEKNPHLAVLSGPYVYYDIPKWQQFLVRLYWLILAMPAYWAIGYMTIGGNFAIRKTVLEKMNGFDTMIEFYGEDTDIARRAHKFGKVKFSPVFLTYTSGRRIEGMGIFSVAFTYVLNFFSEVLFHKPANKDYTDIR